MKKIEYASSKIEKRIERMKSENEYDFRQNEIVRTKESFSADPLHQNILLSGRYIMLAECLYMEADWNETIKSLNYGIDNSSYTKNDGSVTFESEVYTLSID